MTQGIVPSDSIVCTEVEVLGYFQRGAQVDPGIVIAEAGLAGSVHIGGVHPEVMTLIRAIREISAPAPEIVPVVLVLIRVIILIVAVQHLGADIQPINMITL